MEDTDIFEYMSWHACQLYLEFYTLLANFVVKPVLLLFFRFLVEEAVDEFLVLYREPAFLFWDVRLRVFQMGVHHTIVVRDNSVDDKSTLQGCFHCYKNYPGFLTF